MIQNVRLWMAFGFPGGWLKLAESGFSYLQRLTPAGVGGSKLPAANSRSGSTEGHGASGNLCATGVLLAVCGFSPNLVVKKRGNGRKRWRKGPKIQKSFGFV